VPPLIAHINVALSRDRAAVLDLARTRLVQYGRLPFYLKMFEDAGFPVQDGVLTDALLDQLVISGDAGTVIARLHEIQAAGIAELLVAPLYVGGSDAEELALLRHLGQA
jgi:alkanesulfonate monooxygenase SsuD/methylene tetrahydromethanopterin reductase-like flavin-dependent oxidoreductase (luciferase family)